MDTPEHHAPAHPVADHVSVKGHNEIHKAAKPHAPSPAEHVSHESHEAHDVKEKCDTPSCKAARGEHHDVAAKAAIHPASHNEHHSKPKMEVVHKAEKSAEHHAANPAHGVKTRPVAKHVDPATKAH